MEPETSWICEGQPKDGKDYGVEPHSPVENHGPDCTSCGLPKEAVVVSSSKTLLIPIPHPRPLLPLTLVTVLVVAATIVGTQSAHIPGLCQLGDQCPLSSVEDGSFTAQYQQLNKEADTAQKSFTNAKTLEEVKKARDTLGKIVNDLSQIKKQASAYQASQDLLVKVQQQLQVMDAKLTKEQQAKQLWQQAFTTSEQARKDAKAIQTLADFQGVINSFQQAQNQLQKVPQDSFTAKNAQARAKTDQKELDALKAQYRQDQETLNQLDNAKTIAEQAVAQVKTADTVEKLQQAQKKLQQATTQLSNLPKSTLAEPEINDTLEKYEEIDRKIDQALKKTPCKTALFGECLTLPLTLQP